MLICQWQCERLRACRKSNILKGGDFSSSILVFAEIMNALLVVLTVQAVDH